MHRESLQRIFPDFVHNKNLYHVQQILTGFENPMWRKKICIVAGRTSKPTVQEVATPPDNVGNMFHVWENQTILFTGRDMHSTGLCHSDRAKFVQCIWTANPIREIKMCNGFYKLCTISLQSHHHTWAYIKFETKYAKVDRYFHRNGKHSIWVSPKYFAIFSKKRKNSKTEGMQKRPYTFIEQSKSNKMRFWKIF